MSRDYVNPVVTSNHLLSDDIEDDEDEDDIDDSVFSEDDEDDDEETAALLSLNARTDTYPGYVNPALLDPASVHHQYTPNGHASNTVRISIPPSAVRRSKGYGNGYADHYSSDGFQASNDPEAQILRPSLPEPPRKRYPKEIKKTFIACLFMIVNFVLTAVSLAFVHEDRPLYKPLPDQILDRVHYQQWGLTACEILISCQTTVAALVIIFHKHRFIVLRRVMLVVGVLYLYRAITMWVTVLPSADPNYECAPKFKGPLTFKEVFHRVFQIITGFGLSINGKHVYCGDFIYSGHTMMIILGYLIVNEYAPSSLWLMQWATLGNAVTAIALLLSSRGHYTVDVIIAYFIVTRLWSIYHTLAGHIALKQESSLNHIGTFWWFRGFAYMEANVNAGKLPNELNWPLQALRHLKNRLGVKREIFWRGGKGARGKRRTRVGASGRRGSEGSSAPK